MADVFISYSRKDSAFARKLERALYDTGQESWVDWSSIPYSEDWWQEICAGIDGADNFLFVMSPDSLMSMVCNKELAYAREQNKRIIPILHREVMRDGKPLSEILTAWYAEDWEQTADDNLAELQRLNWLFFREEDDFEDWFEKLITTAETNPEHVKNHTRLLLWAREWERQGKNPSNLLKGDDLTHAEAWLGTAADQVPQPADLHRQYIAESRRVEDELAAEATRREQLIRRFRLAAASLFVVGVLAVIAAVGAFVTSQEAQALRQEAQDQYQIAVEFANAMVLDEPNPFQLITRMDILVDRYPTHALAYFSRGLALARLEQYEEAIADYNQAINLEPQYAFAFNSRGIAYMELGQYEEAIADYSQAISLDPQYTLAYNNRGIIYLELGQYEEAITDFTQAINLDPQLTLAYNNRGNTFSELQQYEEALTDYNQAINLDLQYTDAYNNRGNLYAKLQQYEKAIADYTKAISLDPQYAIAYNNRGYAYYTLGQYGEAIADYTQAISLDPLYTLAYNNRGYTYYNLGQYDLAISDYTQAIATDSVYADAYNNRGNAYKSLGQYDLAISDYTQAITINPQYSEAYHNRGNVYGDLERYEEAIADFSQAIFINSQLTPAYFSRALTYVYINQPENAENDLAHYLNLGGPLSEAERTFFEEAGVTMPSN
ncbi:MAG: tetratricopeptide repeat protein [Anaerolineaceae bacterium]|nr:tetratricopeptide repeat protein [Anaerolineaceae bacterium]